MGSKGIGDACRKLNTPVTGGNVSFYNQSQDYAVYPTPVIGMLGLIEDINLMMTSNFKNDDDIVYVLGENLGEIGGSEYLKSIHGLIKGDAPDINTEKEMNLYKTLLEIIRLRLINSAHDISEGGLAVALAECCIMDKRNQIGCEINYNFNFRKDFDLFSESQSRVIISASRENRDKIIEVCNKFKTKILKIGVTGGNLLSINKDINIML
ncbi:MAG: AIR synthase-related protein, partial [Acidobacteria bacterium]|nr:AIR synthase-related protein [Acidobacteriota bacterium]